MAFRFNFSGNDDSSDDEPPAAVTHAATATPVQVPPRYHTLEELIDALPQNISYSTLVVGTSVRIPRRELYDVRMQLMAEDKLDIAVDGGAGQEQTLAGLGEEDIRTSFYEGGLKSWECSVDLVRYLSGEGEGEGEGRVLELGCGTSLPTLYLLQSALGKCRRSSAASPHHFTLADYNIDVLRLVTVPNLFLTWAQSRTAPDGNWGLEGDFDVTPDLRAEFTADLRLLGITVDFVSGGWCKDMLSLPPFTSGAGGYDLVLGSETIYSPAATGLFTDVLLGALRAGGRGLVAAKQIYFGVGGSVADFVGGVSGRGAGWASRTVQEERSVGVGRCIVEVSRRSP